MPSYSLQSVPHTTKIYLAGPDVFYPDAKERGQRLKDLCTKYGFEGHYPLDNEIKETDSLGLTRTPFDMGVAIYEANTDLIYHCDVVLANLSPFRGPSADVGTVFEVGFAAACGKQVFGYSDQLKPYKERVQPDGLFIEDFEMYDNLMVASACPAVFNTVEEALAHMQKIGL